MTIDPTSAALGALVALAVVSIIAVSVVAAMSDRMERMRKALRDAWHEIRAQQDDIDSLFEITPRRLPNGRFAKRRPQ